MFIFCKSVFWTGFYLSCLLIITLVIIGAFGWQKLSQFSSAAGQSPSELWHLLQAGLQTKPKTTDGRTVFLILGTDELASRPNQPTLTDTMMLLSLNPQTATVSTLTIPRDLWSSDYKTRFNALYEYGKERYPTEPERFPREAIERLLGVSINYTLVVSISDVSQLIDTLGGIDVDVTKPFTDTAFPRTDVDVTAEKDPTKLYETIIFSQGVEHMTGDRALKYMRSRHAIGLEGTDTARAERQQAVFGSVIALAKERQFYFDTTRLGKLFAFYTQHFERFLPKTEGIGLVHSLLPVYKKLQFRAFELPVAPADPAGVITHPAPIKTKGEWVWEVVDLERLRSFARAALE